MERLLNLEFTTICYANCVMCPRNVVKEQGYIDEKTIDNVLEFAKQQQLFEISISGRGEPTLHPNTDSLLKRIHKLNVPLSIVTTTDGMNEENYKKIIDNIDILRISVSSIKKETFKKIHRGLDYDKIWKMIDKIVQYAPEKIHIHLVGGSTIYDGIEETIEYFKNRNIDKIFLFPLWNRAGDLDNNEENYRKKIIDKYNIYYSEDEYMDEEKTKQLSRKTYCPVGDSSIMINYKGDFIGCFQDFANRTVIGNINDKKYNDMLLKREACLGCMPVCQECNTKQVINHEY